MSVPLEVPDLLAGVVAWLDAGLSEPVSVSVPNPRPDEFVTVREVGGAGRVDLVLYRSTVQYFGWAESFPVARELAARVRSRLHGLTGETVGGVWFGRVADAGGLAMMPDPESETPRYIGTVEVWTREQVL